MSRYLPPPLITFAASNPISLFCLATSILYFTAQYIPGSHLANMCNTICLIFLTTLIAARTLPFNHATQPPDALQTLSPSLSTYAFPLSPTPHSSLLLTNAQGRRLCGSSSDSELTLESQTQTRSSISCLRDPSKVRLRSTPYLTATALPSHLDSGLGLSISSLEGVPFEDEAAEPIVPSNFSGTNPDTGFPVVGGDPESPFRDQPSPLLSESSAS